MKRSMLLLMLCVDLFLILISSIACSDELAKTVFDFSAQDIRGKTVKLDKYHGKVLLIVNVATYCGFTSTNYPDLVKMQDILGHDNLFTILAFPCNQFGEQEPDTDREIEEFVSEIYKVNFPLFSKIEVAGEGAHPLFKYLKDKTKVEPTWNFYKYLVDHRGKILKQWEPEIPLEEIFASVEEAVAKARKEQETKSGSKNEL